MVNELHGAAALGLAAPDAANENARELAGNMGVRAGFRQETNGILEGFGDADKPLPTAAADLAQFLTPPPADLATDACHCRGAGTCETCSGWTDLARRIDERAAAELAPKPPLSLPRAAGAVLRFPANAVRLRSVGRAAWVLDFEIQETRQ